LSRTLNVRNLTARTYLIMHTPVDMTMPDGPYIWMQPVLHDQVTKLGCRVRELRQKKLTPFTEDMEIEVVDPDPVPTLHHHAWSNPRPCQTPLIP
jgi:hypothetical protein